MIGRMKRGPGRAGGGARTMSFNSGDVVEALYRAALGRPADSAGVAGYASRLDRDPRQLEAIAGEFFRSEEHMARMSAGLMDHSQFGEYRLILKHLIRNGSRHQIFVDVGARGRDRSNSYDLMKDFGWKAILVEANPELVDSINAEFEGTRFVLENCAVGPEEGVLPFYLGVNDDISSLRQSATASWGEVRGAIEVPVRRLPDLLRDHSVPRDFDILSLDIEGVDVEVLNDLVDGSDYRPGLIVIEASNDFQTKELGAIGCSERVCDEYEIWSATAANLLLVRSG